MLVLIGAGVILVGALVVLIAVLIGGGEDEEEVVETEPAVEEDADQSAALSGDTPHAAVESYFTALAEGDAETARLLLYDVSDNTYLTEEMLAASLEIAPIADVEVTEEEMTDEIFFSQEVQVSYTLGDSPVTKRLYAYQNRDTDDWQVAASSNLRKPDFGGLTTTINGEPFEGREATVFLGLRYQLELDDENFAIDGDGLVEATDTFAFPTDLQMALTEEATEAWRAAIISEVEECVASTEREAGCGLDLPENVSGATIIDGTVSRSLSAEAAQALQRLTPRLSFSAPTLVGAEYFNGRVNVTYEAEEGGVTNLYELAFGDAGALGTPFVDMTAEELEVVWE